ncbi:MAG: ABC transporter ATP-binding protein [Candidatus Yanofskybacteria bacterium]|nr:ABC transporter ATP-binding protein [Candidatus Yanofskybacteria bacterium]
MLKRIMGRITNPGILLMIKHIRAEGRQIKKVFAVAVCGAVLGAFVPLVYGKVIRMAGDGTSAIEYILLLVLMWMTIDQVRNWTTRYSDRQGVYASWGIDYNLFMDSLAHLIRLPMSYLSEQRLGKTVQRVERGADSLGRMVRDVLVSLAPHFLSLVFSFVFMFWIQWQLGVLVLLTVISYTLAMASRNKKIVALNRENRKIWEAAWGHMWDVVSNAKAVKANTNEEFEIKRIKDNFDKCYANERKAQDLRNKIQAYEHFIFGGGSVLTLALGALMLRWGMIDAGGLFSFLGYIQLAYTPFSRLAHNWRFVLETLVIEERVAKFLDEKEEDYESGERVRFAGDIEFHDVTFRYGESGNEILKNINLTVKEGETVAIVGESGVGKTTLIDLISRYYSPTKGEITIGGRDIRKWTLDSLRSQIAVVPQDLSLLNDTIKLNIAYGDIERMTDDSAIEDVARASYAHNFITGERFVNGYDQIVGERGVKLSAGQKQRVAIARALLRDPRILILDEATSALDSESEMYVQQALEALIKSRTTFIIAHRLSTIKKADKIVVMHEGTIVEIGKHDELMARGGIYKKLVDLQSFQT